MSAQTSSADQKQFDTAVRAQQQGRTAEAISLYESLLRLHPEALPVRANLAGLLVETGQFDPALELYRDGLRMTPTSKELQLGMAYVYGRQGTTAGLELAAKALEMMHRRDPTDDQTSMLLADSYVRQARYAEALPLLTTLEQAHAGDKDIDLLTGSALLGVGKTAEGLQRFDGVAAATGNPEAYLLAGRARLDLQQFDLAKADALASLKSSPEIPGGNTLLGRALEHLGDYDGSVAALHKAVAQDDTDFNAHFYLGAVLLFQRELPEAEAQLRHALALQPDSAEARYKLALLEQSQGKNDAAVQDLQTVIGERMQWLEPRTTLVALLFKLHRNEEATNEKDAADKLAATLSAEHLSGASH